MLYGPNGRVVPSVIARHARPEPQPEAEARVRAQLKGIDELLDVKWFPYAIFNEKHKSFEGRYALVCKWPQGDKRWELYQSGEIEDPVDMFGWFCEDIHNAESMPVSVDSIEQKVVELLSKCDATRIPHSTRLKQIVERNAKVRRDRRSVVSDKAEDVARTLWNLVGKADTTTVERIMKEIGDNPQ